MEFLSFKILQRIKFEHAINFGREVKSADIVIFYKDRPTVEYIIVEIKKPKLQDGKNQLRSYTNAIGAPIAVWTNGSQISHYNRKDPNYFEDITDIPKADQTLSDILNFPLPKIDWNIQKEIKEKITEMYKTKNLSKSLLEIAKRGVEIAIKKNKQEAGKWIENKLAESGVKI